MRASSAIAHLELARARGMRHDYYHPDIPAARALAHIVLNLRLPKAQVPGCAPGGGLRRGLFCASLAAPV